METKHNFWGLLDIFRRKFSPRTPPPGDGKHAKGSKYPASYRHNLKARRKAQRQHRKRVRLQAKGRKHRFTK